MASEDLLIDRAPAPRYAAQERPSPGNRDMVPHLVHVFPSFRPGGVPLRIVNLINLFGAAYRHSIVSLDNTEGALASLAPDRDASVAPAPAKSRNLLATVPAIHRALTDLKPDLLLTYNWGATQWALTNTIFRHAPHIHFESGFGPEEAERQFKRRILFRRAALRGAVNVVVPSQTLVEIAQHVWKLTPNKVRYVPNGVEVARFAASPAADVLPGFAKRPGEIIVGTVAPLRREKNLERLIQAFTKVHEPPATRLLIVGDGDERARLKSIVDDLGMQERILFPGHTDRVESAFAALDIFAMSSDTEQMPNSLLQAMAAGLPVAATDVGDIRTILPEENRPFIVPKQDGGGLTAALRTLIHDASLRERLGRRNREHVRATYSMERMLEAYDDLYRSAMAGSHGRRAR